MNVKPIVVMYLPPHFVDNGWEAGRVMNILNGTQTVENETNNLQPNDFWNQYYWFVFYKDEIDAPELQVFYEKDFTPIKFEELKAFISDSIKQDNK